MEISYMKLIFKLVAVVATLNATVCAADKDEVVFGLEYGQSSTDTDANLVEFSEDFDDEGYAIGYILGYRWANNIVVEANKVYSSNDILFRAADHYESNETKLMMGYSFDITERLRLIPMVGISQWRMDIKQGSFLNPGPEAEKRFDGTDLTFKLRLDIPIKSLVVLSASYARSEFDIGAQELIQFGIKFEI
jgi:hypothetical protein